MKRFLLVIALVATLPRASFAQTPAPRQTTQGFSVTLLLGEGQAGPAPEGLSDGARKALADMKDFLPYKSYRVLDNQWLTATGASGNVASRLRGSDPKDLDLVMGFILRPPGAIDLTFRLSDGRAPTGLDETSEEVGAARERIKTLEASLAKARERYADNHPEIVKQLAQLQDARNIYQTRFLRETMSARNATRADLLNTSFSMSVGDTVVVGTSRVQGDKALIVLLTAVPRVASQTTSPTTGRIVLVSGEVRSPGKYHFEDGMTVQQLLGRAGGTTSGSTNILIVHATSDGGKAGSPVEGQLSTMLTAGDIVNVVQRKPRD